MVGNESDAGLTDEILVDDDDPATGDLDLATHWRQVYAELLSLTDRLEAAHSVDLGSLRRQAALYRQRMAFWDERCQATLAQLERASSRNYVVGATRRFGRFRAVARCLRSVRGLLERQIAS
jgi:hypothetical protein